MRSSILCLSLLITVTAAAQPFAIGHSTVDLYDAVRMRDVPTELYYPADGDGEDVPAAAGSFPVLVMGHGFVMSVASYANVWSRFVPEGFIVALPNTETGFAPDHGEFGADLAFVAEAVQTLNADAGSPLFEHVDPADALMGHSMGGGASFLGAAGNSAIDALVNFAAAETSPSAIAAAPLVTVPTLVFAASEDCVTPIADHQQPMYDALTVDCRAFVTITGGGHCYFADQNFNCSFGEFTCGPALTITRAEQHDVMGDLASLWLHHFLMNDGPALAAFSDSVLMSTRLAASISCISTAVPRPSAPAPTVVYDVAMDQIVLLDGRDGKRIDVRDIHGRTIGSALIGAGRGMDARELAPGTYLWSLERDGQRTHGRVLIVR